MSDVVADQKGCIFHVNISVNINRHCFPFTAFIASQLQNVIRPKKACLTLLHQQLSPCYVNINGVLEGFLQYKALDATLMQKFYFLLNILVYRLFVNSATLLLLGSLMFKIRYFLKRITSNIMRNNFHPAK
jgi:hypothetical protein